MNKYKDIIKEINGIISKITLNENEKVRKLAANGVVIPPPPKNELITIMFFLRFDENNEISQTAKEKFLSLPENIILEALKAPLHKYVIAGCYHYLTKSKEEQNLEIFKAIIKHQNFKFNLIFKKLNQLNTDLKSYLAEALSFISPYPQVMEFLIKSEIPNAQKQKIIDFAKRNNINIKIEELDTSSPAQTTKNKENKTLKPKDIPSPSVQKEKETEKIPPETYQESIKEEKEEISSNEISGKYTAEAEKVPEERKSLIRIINEMNISDKIKLAMKGNMEARSILIKQSNRLIVEGVIRNPMITEQEIVKFSADKNIHKDVIRYIANNRQWLRKYTIKKNVVLNPKTPTGRAIKLMTTLRYNDIKKIAKMKDISSSLRRAAQDYVERQEKKKRKK